MKITWNWGTGLVIGMAAFMLMILALVARMASVEVSLVEKDYYPKGLAYQDKLDKVQNTEPYASDIVAKVENKMLTVSFPDFFQPDAVKGNVWIYHRVTDSKDVEVDLKLDQSGMFRYPATNMRGRYIIKIDWEHNGVAYYTEKRLTID